MPLVTFSSENKVQQDNSFPTLKLAHGERALVAALEKQPTIEYVHTLRAPAIGPDGRVIKEEKENSKGETYTTTKMEFFGQHLCFGDFGVVSEKGTDPENCPTCRAAVNGEGAEAPKPRYAMHVIRYGLKPGGWDVREPFSVTCEAWVFPAQKFNTLVDLASDWNLQEHDLKLGPCENKDFQKYDINVSSKAEWATTKERQKLTAETLKNNQAPDLSALIGRKVDKSKVQEDLARVAERLDEAYGRSEHTGATDLSSLTDSIFETAKDKATEQPAKESASSEPPFKPDAKPAVTLEELMANL